MIQGKTLQQLAIEVAEQKKSKRDFLVPSNRIKMVKEDGLELLIPGRTSGMVPTVDHFGIRDLAHGQIAERLNIPKRYYDMMKERAPDLLLDNVNHWLGTTDDRRMIRTMNNQARAVLSDHYRRLDNDELAEHLLPPLFDIPGITVKSAEITETRLYLQVVNTRVQGEVRKGDIVQAGVCISNSEVGCGALQIQPLVFRLICLNGAIMNDSRLRRSHLGIRQTGGGDSGMELPWERLSDEAMAANDKALWLAARDIAKSSLEDAIFQQNLEMMRKAAGQKIERTPQDVVELIAKKYNLNEGEEESVLAFLASGGDMTRWGLTNAVTRLANDITNYDRAVELERIGGQILEMPDNVWGGFASRN